MRLYWHRLIILLLISQGIYDLALGGWFWLLQGGILQKNHATAQERLHALYCRCQHCPDVAKCCCIPSRQLNDQPEVRQCDPVDEAKIPNTWNSRVVSAAIPEIPLLYAEEFASAGSLCASLLSTRIDHPPRVSC